MPCLSSIGYRPLSSGDVVSTAPIWQLLAKGKVTEAEALCNAQVLAGARHADLDCQLAITHEHHQCFEQAEALGSGGG
jgi:hypothetical protein